MSTVHDLAVGRPSVATGSRRHSVAFWVGAVAFLINMAFSAVPTPLYVLYQHRDHFSTFTITVVYAVYAAGVVVSLFLAGHVSDWLGRKRLFIPALLVNVASAVIFLFVPSLPGLLVARVLSGISVGLMTATATAYIAELHGHARPGRTGRRAEITSTAVNLGGIGVGPLVAGLLAQFAPAPLRLPYIVFGGLLLLSALAVALLPETVTRPDQRPTWRPQRVAVPAQARTTFFAAVFVAGTAFAVFGVFTSLAPSFLAGTLHETSHAVAGAVAFSAFAAGALAQIALGRLSTSAMLRQGVPVLIVGLGLFAAGMWVPSLALFVIGGVIVGAGGGLLFRGALMTAAGTAPAGSRAEVMAGFFLGGYIGLSIPVVILGVATQYVQARSVMLVFVVVAALAVVGSVHTMLRHRPVPAAA